MQQVGYHNATYSSFQGRICGFVFETRVEQGTYANLRLCIQQKSGMPQLEFAALCPAKKLNAKTVLLLVVRCRVWGVTSYSYPWGLGTGQGYRCCFNTFSNPNLPLGGDSGDLAAKSRQKTHLRGRAAGGGGRHFSGFQGQAFGGVLPYVKPPPGCRRWGGGGGGDSKKRGPSTKLEVHGPSNNKIDVHGPSTNKPHVRGP